MRYHEHEGKGKESIFLALAAALVNKSHAYSYGISTSRDSWVFIVWCGLKWVGSKQARKAHFSYLVMEGRYVIDLSMKGMRVFRVQSIP